MKDLIACVLIPVVGFCAGIAMLSCVPRHQGESMDWSQQTLRSPGETDCREAGRLPYKTGDTFIECLPEGTSNDAFEDHSHMGGARVRGIDRIGHPTNSQGQK